MAQSRPACFKAVLTKFMLSEGFTQCNDAQMEWDKCKNLSGLYNATFVDDIHHCTNDLAMYSSISKRFEKKFDLKSDDHIDVYF